MKLEMLGVRTISKPAQPIPGATVEDAGKTRELSTGWSQASVVDLVSVLGRLASRGFDPNSTHQVAGDAPHWRLIRRPLAPVLHRRRGGTGGYKQDVTGYRRCTCPAASTRRSVS